MRESPPPPRQPTAADGTPVLLAAGPARDAYLETLRQQLDVVRQPPTRVVLAGQIVSVTAQEIVVAPPVAPPQPGGAVVGPEGIFPDFGNAPVHAVIANGTNFLLAHDSVDDLAPGRQIVILGVRELGQFNAVLVTDLSGLNPPRTSSLNSSGRAPGGREVDIAPVPGSTATQGSARVVSLPGAQADSLLVGSTTSNITASGNFGLPGINASLSGMNWNDPAKDCPYFSVGAQLVAGAGAAWNFPLNLGLTAENKLVVQSLAHAATGPGVTTNIGGFSEDTFYAAFGFAASFQIQLGCHVKLPEVDLGFLGKHGGETIGPDFTVGKDAKFLLSNLTQDAPPLWGQQSLSVPATDCFEFGTDGIPGIGDVLKTIHGPAAVFPLCASLSLLPAGLRGTAHDPNGNPHGFSLGANDRPSLGFDVGAAQQVHLDSFNFAPKLHAQIEAGIDISLVRSDPGEQKPQAKSEIPPLATARCKDGSFSFAQKYQGACSGSGGIADKIVPAAATARCNDGTYSFASNYQGACSHHEGIAEKLDPNQQTAPISPDPSPDWQKLASGNITVGPFTIPFLSADYTLNTSSNPMALDLPLNATTPGPSTTTSTSTVPTTTTSAPGPIGQPLTLVESDGFKFKVQASRPALTPTVIGSIVSGLNQVAPPGQDYVAIPLAVTNVQTDRPAPEGDVLFGPGSAFRLSFIGIPLNQEPGGTCPIGDYQGPNQDCLSGLNALDAQGNTTVDGQIPAGQTVVLTLYSTEVAPQALPLSQLHLYVTTALSGTSADLLSVLQQVPLP